MGSGTAGAGFGPLTHGLGGSAARLGECKPVTEASFSIIRLLSPRSQKIMRCSHVAQLCLDPKSLGSFSSQTNTWVSRKLRS